MGVKAVLKNDITDYVHQKVCDTVIQNVDLNIQIITDFLFSLMGICSNSDDTEALQKSAAKIVNVLFRDVVEQSVISTLSTLSDFGLLNQDEIEIEK